MRYYKHLYLSEGLKKKKEKVIRKLENNKVQIEVYLITVPEQGENQLEILNSALFFAALFPEKRVFCRRDRKRLRRSAGISGRNDKGSV